MSFLGGNKPPSFFGGPVQSPQMPSDISGLRGDIISWLRNYSQAPNTGNPPGQSPGAGGGSGPYNGGPNGVYGSLDPNASRTGALPTGGQFGGIFSQGVGPINAAQATSGTIASLPDYQHTTIGPNQNIGTAGPVSAADIYSLLPSFYQSAVSRGQNFGSNFDAGAAGYTPASAAGVRPVSDIASVAGMSHNLADIVNSPGVNGYFRDNVLAPYRAAFATQRGDALAQAKESAGNLTGSGYYTGLGNVVNKSLSEEEAKLSDALTGLATQESGRQLQVAGLEQGKNIQNQNTDLARALADASNSTNASIANAGASGNIASTLARSQGDILSQILSSGSNLAINQGNRADAASQFNAQQANQAAIEQARLETQRAVEQGRISQAEADAYFKAAADRNIQQATLNTQTSQFNTGQTNSAAATNQATQQQNNQFNAKSLLDFLMSLSTTGVSSGQTQYQPGLADSIPDWISAISKLWGNNTSPTTPLPPQRPTVPGP